ncbi:MAG: hypothetical protein DMF52_01785 [Acidobacteria bacterium]|nr:MAG: hypothetical protein DMF52_01785 [Acidobacteriota bacterium]
MLEILVLIVALPVIAAIAKGRGASPWVAGLIALGGHVALPMLMVVLFGRTESTLLTAMVVSYVWLALVAAYYRFMVGKGRPQPTGIWSCKNCSYTNKPYALSCGACGKPWESAPDV